MADEITPETTENINEDVHEPQINSSDPKERKIARQIRITTRAENIRKQHLSVTEEIDEEAEKSLTDKQIGQSAELLDQIIIEGDEIVTNVCIGNDAREVNRRDKEEAKRAELQEKLENEVREAEELYNKIDEKWEKIKNYKDPLVINESIIMQKEKCDELIQQKDEIIAMLREEINIAEKRFIEDQAYQSGDIATLVRRINEQVVLMRNAYRNELDLIQQAVNAERNIMAEDNKKEWDVLYKQRDEKEDINMETKLELMDYYMNLSAKLKIENLEKFRETRISLKAETHTLNLELNKLKTTCLLNTEKLDYNYQILKKREDENIIICSGQKRHMNKLRDEINKIRRRSSEFKKVTDERIAKVTSDIHKYRDNVFSIQAKADHYSTANESKYQKVWALNEETVRDLYEKLLQADKIIHEDILGLFWTRKVMQFQPKCDLPCYKKTERALRTSNAQKSLVRKVPTDTYELSQPLINMVLEKIAIRAGFMVEGRLEKIIPDYEKTEQQLIKVDTVFCGMGVENVEDMKLLIKYFIPYTYCAICKADLEKNKEQSEHSNISVTSRSSLFSQVSSLSQSSSTDSLQVKLADIRDAIESELFPCEDVVEESSVRGEETASTSSTSKSVISDDYKPDDTLCQFNHPLYIEHRYIIQALKEYALDNCNEKAKSKKPLLADILQQERVTLSRSMKQEDVQFFWRQFQHSFTHNDEVLWDTLLYGLMKYYNMLQERQKLDDEVKQLDQMNNELKHLLKNCAANKKKADKLKKK